MELVLSLLRRIIAIIAALTALVSGNSGEKVTVTLLASPSSGYEWTCESDAPRVMRPQGSVLENAAQFGDTQNQVFTLVAGRAGIANVTFSYSKTDGGRRETISTYVYTYEVDDKGHPTLLSIT